MLNKLILSTLILLFSCVEENSLKSFEAKLLLNGYSAFQANIFQLGEIERPPGTWVPLLDLRRPTNDHTKQIQICLYYRVPMQKRRGELLLIRHDNVGCQGPWEGNRLAVFSEIKKLTLSLRNFEVNLRLELVGKERSFSVPLVSVDAASLDYPGKRPYQFDRFDSFRLRSWVTGMQLGSLQEGESAVFSPIKAPLIMAEKDGSLEGKRRQICHEVSPQCQTLKEFNCDNCAHGWYEVAHPGCPQGGTKYCGQSRCGERGEPACFRGEYFVKEKPLKFCVTENPLALCQEGLMATCREGKELICL